MIGSSSMAGSTTMVDNHVFRKKRPLMISIEGNIGSGKSSILHHLEQYFNLTGLGLDHNLNRNIMFLKEPVDEWATICDASGETILAKFYKDPAKYAFAFQIMAYATRLNSLRKTIAENPECTILICERSLEADKQIFANMLHDDGLIDDVSYQIYCRNFSEYAPDFKVDKVVYIDASPEKCFSRIAKRSRNGESNIELAYLEKCKKYHDMWLCCDKTVDSSVHSSVELSLHEPNHVLHLNTNADVEYNLSDPDDLGVSWIKQIVGFIHTC
jgi:deoxyadenosine/deoxycytidine kinase